MLNPDAQLLDKIMALGHAKFGEQVDQNNQGDTSKYSHPKD